MGIRFESNYQRINGVTPYVLVDNDPMVRWFRVHEWQVDTGFTGKLLMVMLNSEPQYPLVQTAAAWDLGYMRIDALLDPVNSSWATKWESKMQLGPLSNKMFTPILTIIPVGSGITFTAGQGLATKALITSNNYIRWWSCYVIDAGVA